jgi:hypothetical protein
MRAFVTSGSAHARLYTHRGGKWSTFYSDDALAEQLTFIRAVLDDAETRSALGSPRGARGRHHDPHGP